MEKQPGQQTVNADLQAEMPGQQVENDNSQSQEPANNDHWVRRLSRATRQPERYVPGVDNVADYVMMTGCGELSCFKEAMERQVMASLEKNGTWDLVHLTKGQQTLPCKWVYKMMVTSSSLQKYKARLV